jgi:hypothetical protein
MPVHNGHWTTTFSVRIPVAGCFSNEGAPNVADYGRRAPKGKLVWNGEMCLATMLGQAILHQKQAINWFNTTLSHDNPPSLAKRKTCKPTKWLLLASG